MNNNRDNSQICVRAGEIGELSLLLVYPAVGNMSCDAGFWRSCACVMMKFHSTAETAVVIQAVLLRLLSTAWATLPTITTASTLRGHFFCCESLLFANQLTTYRPSALCSSLRIDDRESIIKATSDKKPTFNYPFPETFCRSLHNPPLPLYPTQMI